VFRDSFIFMFVTQSQNGASNVQVEDADYCSKVCHDSFMCVTHLYAGNDPVKILAQISISKKLRGLFYT